ncbi:MAG: hypothetical protein AAF558_08665, partial [Verrucomicrobiota bacterium]
STTELSGQENRSTAPEIPSNFLVPLSLLETGIPCLLRLRNERSRYFKETCQTIMEIFPKKFENSDIHRNLLL